MRESTDRPVIDILYDRHDVDMTTPLPPPLQALPEPPQRYQIKYSVIFGTYLDPLDPDEIVEK